MSHLVFGKQVVLAVEQVVLAVEQVALAVEQVVLAVELVVWAHFESEDALEVLLMVDLVEVALLVLWH